MTLVYKSLIITLLTLTFVANANSQTDHLEPTESYFSSWNFSDEYQARCRKILLQNLNKYFVVRVVVFPSSQKEYLLTIEKKNNDYILMFRQPSIKIWSKADTTKITTVDKTISVDSSFTETLRLAFEKLILESMYSKKTNRCEADGTEFQFITFQKGQGQITGRTWDCAESKRMKTLLDLVNLLQKVCVENSLKKSRSAIINKCNFLLAN